MKKFSYNKMLIAIIFVGLIASLFISFQRHLVEEANSQIEMAVDFDSLYNLAEREGIDFSTVLSSAKQAGITSLAIYETSLEKLTRSGKVIAVSGSEIIGNYHSGSLSDFNFRLLVETSAIDPNKIYIIGHDPVTYLEMKSDLLRRIGAQRVKELTVGDNEVLEVKAQYAPFMSQRLGLPTSQLQIAREFGFNILARPSNYSNCTAEDVRAVFNRLEGFPVTAIVFEGNQVLGSPNEVKLTASQMRQHNITFGLIEHVTQLQFYPQRGLEQLAQLIGYNHCARLYAIPKDEQPKLDLNTAVNRWSTTDRERNIRINLLRIFDKPLDDMSLFESNMQYFKQTSAVLRDVGFSFGKPSSFDNFYPNKILRALVVIGVAAALVLYLSLISKRINNNDKLQLLLFAILAIIMMIPILIGAGGKVRLFAALASANIFPALAIIWQLDSIRFMKLKEYLRFRRLKGSNKVTAVIEHISLAQMIFLAIVALLITGTMSMIGAFYLSASLSDVEYFLEFEIFRGIKLTFILPLLLVAIAFLQRFSLFSDLSNKDIDFFSQLKRLLNENIKVKWLFGFFIVLIAFVVLIARSGHTAGMPVSAFEIKFRAFLEQLFYARPRSKELLIGHPAFMLAIFAFFKKSSPSILFILVIIATIGQSSMVETFAHMRTPFFMSFMRGFDGLIFGALLGIIPMIAIHFWNKRFV